jgi:Flp pilus assembly protein TadG
MRLMRSWTTRRPSLPAVGRLRSFGRNENAATAVEFALLALPFFTIVFAILETAIVFLASQILDSAINDSSRLIRTGQAQSSSYTADDYRDAICSRLFGLFDCNDTSKLLIRVTTIDDFRSATTTTPITPNCTTPTNCQFTLTQTFDPGVGSEVVLVEAYYKWPTVVNLPLFNLATMADGTRLLAAARVFQNEPFS